MSKEKTKTKLKKAPLKLARTIASFPVKENLPLQAEINIGMIGHVDHGKTTLTMLLTGKWTDTHSEELKQGISIRLGYADTIFRQCPKCKSSEAYTTEQKCPNCNAKTKILRRVSFVDAPGHETLMTTMLSGAALMDGAILVVAANEEVPQPRTVEHLMALKIAGIKNIVVVQNKIDLVERQKALENYKQIKAFLEEHGYGYSAIIPLAANFGTNKDLLIEAIEKTILTPEKDLSKQMKMFIARSFDINKPGISPDKLLGGVIGGTIKEGKIKIGDKIEIAPGNEGKKIISEVFDLSTANGKLKEAFPGGLIAIGTLLDPSLTKSDQMRGQVCGLVDSLPEPVNQLSMNYEVFERLLTDISERINLNELLILTVGTATIICRVAKITPKQMQLDLKIPAIIESGQRIAISKKIGNSWRLYAFGTAQ